MGATNFGTKRRTDEPIDSLLRRFNKKRKASGIVPRLRELEAHVKPSDKRRKERSAGRYRARRREEERLGE